MNDAPMPDDPSSPVPDGPEPAVRAIRLRTDVRAQLVDSMGSDASVVAAARVSTFGRDSEEWLSTPPEESSGLIRFLMRNRHGTPFEHNSMTFLVEAPIFVFREFHRHRIGWSYNEESARYRQLEPVFYVPDEGRPLVQIGKPGAYEFVPGTADDQAATTGTLGQAYAETYGHYEYLLRRGVAREVARMCLPVGIYSSMYATCNARSLMAFLSLRTRDERAVFPSKPQHEIELVARAMEAEFAAQFPITYAAYCENGRVCP